MRQRPERSAIRTAGCAQRRRRSARRNDHPLEGARVAAASVARNVYPRVLAAVAFNAHQSVPEDTVAIIEIELVGEEVGEFDGAAAAEVVLLDVAPDEVNEICRGGAAEVDRWLACIPATSTNSYAARGRQHSACGGALVQRQGECRRPRTFPAGCAL